MVRVAEYQSKAGPVVRVTFDHLKVLRAGAGQYDDPKQHVLAVLDCVIGWNVLDAKPSRKAWKAMPEFAEGVAREMILKAGAR